MDTRPVAGPRIVGQVRAVPSLAAVCYRRRARFAIVGFVGPRAAVKYLKMHLTSAQ